MTDKPKLTREEVQEIGKALCHAFDQLTGRANPIGIEVEHEGFTMEELEESTEAAALRYSLITMRAAAKACDAIALHYEKRCCEMPEHMLRSAWGSVRGALIKSSTQPGAGGFPLPVHVAMHVIDAYTYKLGQWSEMATWLREQALEVAKQLQRPVESDPAAQASPASLP